MRDRTPSRAAPFLWTVLSSALCAALLNLATGVLDHPRAFASWLELGLPLLVAFGVCALAAGAVLGVARLLGRRLGFAGAPLGAALCTGFVLALALAPMVEVGLRDASRERAEVLLACAAGFVSCAALVAGFLSARRAGLGAAALVLAPLGSSLALAVAWSVEYRAEGLAARAGVGLLACGLLVVFARALPRLLPAPTMSALGALVVVLAALDLVHPATPTSPARPPTSDRPPVILLTVDTLRADRVLGDGPERVPTPAIDGLARDSVVFTNTRAAAPWTKPSLATILTGLSPLVHGMTTRRARLPEGVETLAERLHSAGYHTAGIGLNAHLERAFRLDQGFDEYDFPARPDYGIALGARVLEHLAPARFPALYPSTEAIADVAIDWLHGHAREPFFLWVHVLDPHWPYEPPSVWLEHPEREPRRWGDPEKVTNVQAGNLKPWPEEKQRVRELYAGEIRYVDANLARVLATLKELGLYERALIVFASDHGEEFWEHGRYEHGHTLYDEVLHVPLFFKLPGVAERASVDACVSSQAIVPTVLDVLGLAFDPETLSSRSLAAWWRAPADAREEPLFSGGTYYFGEKRAVVFEGKKLVLELDTNRCELYDLARDPHEKSSIAAGDRADQQRGLELIQDWEQHALLMRQRLGISAADQVADPETERRLQQLGYGGNQ